MRNRYETGLEKLDFAAGQVSVMQDQLTALKPKLVETSLATKALLYKIAQDTVKVEAKKQVIIKQIIFIYYILKLPIHDNLVSGCR